MFIQLNKTSLYGLKKYYRRWRQHRAITVDTVDTVDPVDTVDTVDMVYTVDTVDTVDMVYTVDIVYTVDMVSTVDMLHAVDMVYTVDKVYTVDAVYTTQIVSFCTPAFGLSPPLVFAFFAPLLSVPPFLSSTVACQHSNDTYANLPTTILPLSGLAQLSIEKVTSVDVE